MGSCSFLFDALRSSSRAGAIRLQRKTWPLRSRSKLSEGLGAASAGVITRGCPAVHWHIDFFSRPALGAGLVALRQTFVRRCHGGLGSSRTCREIGKLEHDGGASAFGAVKFSGAAKAKRHRPYPWYPPFIGRSTSRPCTHKSRVPCPEAQTIFCRRRHQPRRPPLAKISPGRPAPAIGPGTGTVGKAKSTVPLPPCQINGEVSGAGSRLAKAPPPAPEAKK